MRKNELKICMLSAISIALLILSLICNSKLNVLENEATSVAAQRIEFLKLHQKISNLSLDFGKNKSEFLAAIPNLKRDTLNIAKRFKANKIAIKITANQPTTCNVSGTYNTNNMYDIHNITMQFEIASEQDIYKFLRTLKTKFNVIFNSIHIIKKQSENFKINLEYTCVEFKEIDKNIQFKTLQRNHSSKEAQNLKKIRIFREDSNPQKHILRGVINNSKAFIDGEWKQVGDFIDETTEIKAISDNYITLEHNELKNKIKVGKSFSGNNP